MDQRRDVHNSDLPIMCQACEARHRGVCGALDPQQLISLSKSSSKQMIDAGAELVGDAEAIDSYSNVLAGVVKLTKTLSDGRQQIVGLQFAPDFLGRPFKARKRHQCRGGHRSVAVLLSQGDPGADAAGVAGARAPPAAADIEGARRGQGLDGDARPQDGRREVATFLLLIARNIDPALSPATATVAFNLPLTRADIADFLGLTIETVSRQLTKLRAEGIIRIENNRHVTVDNIARLVRRSGA